MTPTSPVIEAGAGATIAEHLKKAAALLHANLEGELAYWVDEAIAYLNAAPAREAYRPPEGWKLVPIEPTPGMIGAWYRYKNGHHYRHHHDDPAPVDTSDYGAYRAMLAAAPLPSPPEGR